jgi:hypothetical protein
VAVCELKAKGEEKGENTLNKRLAIVKQTKVGGFVLEIDGDGAILLSPFACLSHVPPVL